MSDFDYLAMISDETHKSNKHKSDKRKMFIIIDFTFIHLWM